MGEKKISIVIVTYNSENVIFRCLDSVFKYNDIKDCIEVIVVDNNSQNQLQMFSDICGRYGNKVILLSNPQNGGYGQGNNIGIKASTAPIILIMNPDVSLFFPIFEKAIIQYHEYSTAVYDDDRDRLLFLCTDRDPFYRQYSDGDRKSTRLNSSH